MEKLKKLYDFRELSLPEKLFELPLSRDEVNAALEGVRVRFLTIEEVPGPVEKGDLVVLSLPAGDGKTIQVNVGKHFYDDAFEDALAGAAKGAEVTLPKRDGSRPATVAQIKRRILPPLTDELVARMSVDGVNTIDAFRKATEDKIIRREKRKKMDAILTVVMRDTAANCEFGDIAADVEKQLANNIEDYRRHAARNEMTLEEYYEKALPKKFETQEELDAILRERAEQDVRLNLIGRYYMEQAGKTLSREEYEKIKKGYLDRGMSPQDVETLFTYAAYETQTAAACFQDAIKAFYDDKFKVVEK